MIQFFRHNHLCYSDHIFRHKKTVCKIIRTSCRNISNRNTAVHLHNAGNNFIQRTVTTAAYNQINGISILLSFLICISGSLRGTDNNLIIMAAEYIYNVQQMRLDLSFSCFWIKHKKHFFCHGLISPFFFTDSVYHTTNHVKFLDANFLC